MKISTKNLHYNPSQKRFPRKLPPRCDSDQEFLTLEFGWMSLRRLLFIESQKGLRALLAIHLVVVEQDTGDISFEPLQGVTYLPDVDGGVWMIENKAKHQRFSIVVTKKQEFLVYPKPENMRRANDALKETPLRTSIYNILVLKHDYKTPAKTASDGVTRGGVIRPVVHASNGFRDVPQLILQLAEDVCGKRWTNERTLPETRGLMLQSLLWILGFWLGDGWMRASKEGGRENRLAVGCSQRKESDIELLRKHFKILGLKEGSRKNDSTRILPLDHDFNVWGDEKNNRWHFYFKNPALIRFITSQWGAKYKTLRDIRPGEPVQYYKENELQSIIAFQRASGAPFLKPVVFRAHGEDAPEFPQPTELECLLDGRPPADDSDVWVTSAKWPLYAFFFLPPWLGRALIFGLCEADGRSSSCDQQQEATANGTVNSNCVYTSGPEWHLDKLQMLMILYGWTAHGIINCEAGDSHEWYDAELDECRTITTNVPNWKISFCDPNAETNIQNRPSFNEEQITRVRDYNHGVWRITAPDGCCIIARRRGARDRMEKATFFGSSLDLTISKKPVEEKPEPKHRVSKEAAKKKKASAKKTATTRRAGKKLATRAGKKAAAAVAAKKTATTRRAGKKLATRAGKKVATRAGKKAAAVAAAKKKKATAAPSPHAGKNVAPLKKKNKAAKK
jgi:hypothetical protein